MDNLSLEKQFDEVVIAKMKAISDNLIKKACYEAANSFMHWVDMAGGFYDVTGNLFKSYAVGIFYDGKLLDIVTVDGKEPTMKSLKKGQMYPLKYYYSGELARRQYESYGKTMYTRPYVGETGRGGKSGPVESRAFLNTFNPVNKKGFSLVVVAGMNYAEFVESKENHDVLSGLRDDAMMIFGRSI